MAIAAAFQVRLSRQSVHDATVLAWAVECIDRTLDALPAEEERRSLAGAILKHLEQGPAAGEAMSFELTGWLDRLAETMRRLEIEEPFLRVSGVLLANCERMRSTPKAGCFIECALTEGRLLVELLLLILQGSTTPQFDGFFRRLAGPANLVDKLVDARRDYKHGELGFRPGLFFYARLTGALFKRLLPLVPAVALRPRLCCWGVRSMAVHWRSGSAGSRQEACPEGARRRQ
jgi:hypothetical protein